MPPTPLTIKLFGPWRVEGNGEPLPRMRTRSVEWVLALLVLRHGRAVDREWLAGTLWLDSERDQALRNLRNNLSHLRAALGPEGGRIVAPSRGTISLDLDGAEVDVFRFDRGIQSPDEKLLREAVKAYSAPLLEGCQEEWAYLERESRAAQFSHGLERLVDLATQRSDYGEALSLLKRAEAFEPLKDSTARMLMKVLQASGDTAAALEVYQRLRYRLHDELSMSPDPETTDLFQLIRGQTKVRAVEERPVSIRRPPQPLSPLVGRQVELAAVAGHLRASRLVTLVGAGGVGKTRLSVATAHLVAREFGHGAAFVELAPVSEGAVVLSQIALALGLREDDAKAESNLLVKAVAGWLSHHDVLLVIDNCEHLVDASAAVIQDLLERSPNLRVLATSRQRLGIASEVVFRVPSLEFPSEGSAPTDADTFPACRLFLDRAKTANPSLDLADPELALAASHICRRLDGIPLAIELAAARLTLLSVGQIASRLSDRFRLLTAGNRSAMPRQQTLQALIDWSYDLLSPQEQEAFRDLSVFAGDWTLEAAEAAGLDIDLLGSLVDKSLVMVQPLGSSVRYRMQESIREYASDKLRELGGEAAARDRHLAYFRDYAEAAVPAMAGPNPQSAFVALDLELANLRAAMKWAQGEDRARLAAALWRYWEMRGPIREGREFCRAVLATQATGRQRAEVLLGAASLAFVQRELDETVGLAVEAICEFRALRDPRSLVLALILCGHANIENKNYDGAHPELEEALALSRRQGWTEGTALVLTHLGLLEYSRKQVPAARSYLEEAVKIAEGLGSSRTLALALHNLGYFAEQIGDFDFGARMMLRSLEIWRGLGHRHKAALSLRHLGMMERRRNRPEAALSYFDEAIDACREQGAVFHLAFVLMEAGNARFEQDDYPRARTAFSEAIELFAEVGDGWGLNGARMNLSTTLFRLDEVAESKRLAQLSLGAYRELDNRDGIVWCLDRLALAGAGLAEAPQGARLMGIAAAARRQFGQPMGEADLADWEIAEGKLRGSMGEPRFNEAWASGETLALDAAIEVALAL